MGLKVFNNLNRKKEAFTPKNGSKVHYYSCGPTTYDFLHVGNARALVVGDLIHRSFKALGYDTIFVRNFTDVDDKIIERAHENGIDPIKHAQIYVDECIKDMNSLNMLPATHTPKVSETMVEIVEMIKTLVEKDCAYVTDSGEVLYDVPKFKDYGKLSKKKLEDLLHGMRVATEDHKKSPSDFVLWKPAKVGEPAWDSPWGKGRPGWHIECSAMSKKFLGETLDIHHGGIDLMFPHHENEIAQSEAANGCKFCNNWVHNEFLNFGSEKMSKSLGNVVTMRDFINTYGGQVLRQVLISVHYRSVMDWTEDVINRGLSDTARIHQFVLDYNDLKIISVDDDRTNDVLKFKQKMISDLENDFNSAGALSEVFSLIRFVRREFPNGISKINKSAVDEVLTFANLSLGVINDNPQEVLDEIRSYKISKLEGISEEEIAELASKRIEAKNNKDYSLSDEIRDKLLSKGIIVQDNPDGTWTWDFK